MPTVHGTPSGRRRQGGEVICAQEGGRLAEEGGEGSLLHPERKT